MAWCRLCTKVAERGFVMKVCAKACEKVKMYSIYTPSTQIWHFRIDTSTCNRLATIFGNVSE